MTSRFTPDGGESVDFVIDAETLSRHIDILGEIGNEDGKLFRPVYTPQWKRAQVQLRDWMDEIGLKTREDPVGNIFGRLDGSCSDAVVLTGSHFDTVRNGGRFDGALGIHSAIAAADAIIRSKKRPGRAIEIVAFAEEEGSRFALSMLGSRSLVGLLDYETVGQQLDIDGVTLSEAMATVGLDASQIHSARRDDLGYFLELHIEQGEILEEEGLDIGVVTAITGQLMVEVTVKGKQNHAGTTPMRLRRDALVAASEMILAIEQIGTVGEASVGTVGQLQLSPGSTNVIPGIVRFTIDARSPALAELHDMDQQIHQKLMEIATRREVTVSFSEHYFDEPVPMNSELASLIEDQVKQHGYRSRRIPSGAGHDSQIIAASIPTAMIFTPSEGGISHSPAENTPIEEILPATAVLASTLWALSHKP